MTYNLTNISQSAGLLELTQNVNTTLMDGWLGILILLSLSFVMFSGFYFSTRDARQSGVATAFLSFLLAVLLRAVGIVPNSALFVTLLLTGGAVAFVWRER